MSAQGIVVTYAPDASAVQLHEWATLCACAKALAAIQCYDFEGEFDSSRYYGRPLYFVPVDTLTTVREARALGIHGVQDLFGGVVPSAFVATKAITHPLVDGSSLAPAGWSPAFGERVANVVLPGYCAFTVRDAQTAAGRLLRSGSVRLKNPYGIGGSGQSVIRSIDQLHEQLQTMDPESLKQRGLVLECNLDNVRTLSVGQVRVGHLQVSYVGRQRLTEDNQGNHVYGGSTLTVVRGDYDALRKLPLPKEAATAIEQARTYHSTAVALYPGLLASRSNYDVAQGIDSARQWRSGVLEQSWRIGGATGAEIAALNVFRAAPSRTVVRASTVEVYGPDAEVPPGAVVYFRGVDARAGELTKYAQVDPDVDS
jgi:Protein of unknown function (DUF3182)